jgi:general secretion pathway protein K
MKQQRFNRRGSALIAVYWMIAILGMVLFGSAKLLKTDTSAARLLRDRSFAKRYAEMGIEIGRHPRMEQYDPLLTGGDDNGGSYQVTLTTEEARFNINTLLLNSDRLILKRIFAHWGLDAETNSLITDALKDWVDADDNVSLNGAEKRDYAKAGFDDLPFNRPFKNLDEVLLVRGMDIIAAMRPDWREWFTVYGDGRIDINEARTDFVMVLANVPPERMIQFDHFRAGPDGIRRTLDDGRISTAVQLAQMLAVFQPKIVAELQQWVQFAGPIRRIESIGRFNDLNRKLILITQNNQTLWRGEVPQ